MLLLEFEFVTLSGYKTDLVAVLNLFVCPEDFMSISSALQGKNAGETRWINTTKKVCVFSKYTKVMVQKKKNNNNQLILKRSGGNYEHRRRSFSEESTSPTELVPPVLPLCGLLSRTISLLYQKLLDVFRPAASYLPPCAAVSFF